MSEPFWVLSGLILYGGVGGKVGWAEDPSDPRVEGDTGCRFGTALWGDDEGAQAGSEKKSPKVSR